jgi:hypothetical protein
MAASLEPYLFEPELKPRITTAARRVTATLLRWIKVFGLFSGKLIRQEWRRP